MACEEGRSRAEADLRIEREWRSALQNKEVEHKENFNKLQMKISHHSEDAKKHEKTRSDLEKLRKKYNEDQQTLEELGIQLSVCKLQMSELKERKISEDLGNGRSKANEWTPDEHSSQCQGCKAQFSLTRRKHHCRSCGEIYCKSCSEHVFPLEDESGKFCINFGRKKQTNDTFYFRHGRQSCTCL